MTRNKNNIVKLDIGGVVFKTTKSTLKKFDGMFKTMMETNIPVTRNKFGAIFIDRDAKHFRLILNFMRDGYVEIPNSEREIREIMMEAQYYLLKDLIEVCHVELEKMCDDEDSTSFFDYSDDDIVTVNVSGKVFQTTRATLTKYDGHFKEIFEGEIEYTKDNTGAIFIDRPAKHFELILNYMRDGQVRFPKSEDEILEISNEAQFYGLGDLFDMCYAKISESGANEQLSKLYNLLPDDIVKLNVGGKVFHTKKATLAKFGLFKRELERHEFFTYKTDIEFDDAGNIFIDRSPKHVDTILNYMRDGVAPLPEKQPDLVEVYREAKHYELHDLVDACCYQFRQMKEKKRC
ncbi:unnamed protein product [Caenorhabditis brenneri]